MPAANFAAQGGEAQIKLFEFYSNYGKTVDVSSGCIELDYYESILDNTIRSSTTFVDTGYRKSAEGVSVFERDDINLTTGEKIEIKIEDGYGSKLDFIGDKHFCVQNSPTVASEEINKVVFSIDTVSQEFIDNTTSDRWVYGRYDGQIPVSVVSILTDCLKTPKDIIVDDGLNGYNFLGHAEKPLYLCTLLGKKCVPDMKNSYGNLAGYLFYETYDGFNFRSIDKLFQQTPKRNFIYNNLIGEIPPNYNGKILEYSFVGALDLKNMIESGAMTNSRLQEYNRYANAYGENTKSSESSYQEYNNGGLERPVIAKHKNIQENVTRHFNAKMSDVGILPTGFSLGAQIPRSKTQNFDLESVLRQSAIRYNQLFSHKLSIAIPGDFELRAGDLIFCDFPEVSGKTSKVVSDKISGIYMIADICHRLTKNGCYSRLNLVRDSIYRKPIKR